MLYVRLALACPGGGKNHLHIEHHTEFQLIFSPLLERRSSGPPTLPRTRLCCPPKYSPQDNTQDRGKIKQGEARAYVTSTKCQITAAVDALKSYWMHFIWRTKNRLSQTIAKNTSIPLQHDALSFSPTSSRLDSRRMNIVSDKMLDNNSTDNSCCVACLPLGNWRTELRLSHKPKIILQ